MRVEDPTGVEWDVTRRFGRPWVVEAKSERGELAWLVEGWRASRRAVTEIAAALSEGDRTYSPPGSTRLLPDSPFVTPEPSGSVRVIRRRS
jgi:hypothetical protein